MQIQDIIRRFWPLAVGVLVLFFLMIGWNRYQDYQKQEDKTAGMIKDFEEVDEAFNDMKRCKHGNAEACLRSGLYYLNGKHISPNRKKAGRYLYRACMLKDPVGCYELGSFWEKGRKARKYYRKACKLHYIPGCDALKKLSSPKRKRR